MEKPTRDGSGWCALRQPYHEPQEFGVQVRPQDLDGQVQPKDFDGQDQPSDGVQVRLGRRCRWVYMCTWVYRYRS